MRSLFDDFYPFHTWLEGRTESNNFVRSNIDFDIQQNGEGDLLIQLALPGVEQKQVNAYTQQGELIVDVAPPEENKDEEIRYLHKGIKSCRRSFRMALGDDFKVDNANFRNGLMELLLKRVEKESEKRVSIPISDHNVLDTGS